MEQREGPSLRTCGLVILGIQGAVLAALMALGPIPQPLAYHDFADQRPWCGIPNFGDVVSNLAFALPGLFGLWAMARDRSIGGPHARLPLLVFLLGGVVVCLGSGYYHLAPNNETLVPDRMAMSVTFMALFAAVLSDRLHPAFGRPLPLLVLLLAGGLSVMAWIWSERAGAGDLRPYFFFNPGVPALAVIFLALARPGRAIPAWGLFGALGIYGIAIVCEQFDRALYEALGMAVSGHTLKHVAAGAAIGVVALAACRNDRRELG